MKTVRANDIRPDVPIWVWDGSWLPAVIAELVPEPDGRVVIVRLENGCSVPASMPDLQLRDPDARGSDRPHFMAPSGLNISKELLRGFSGMSEHPVIFEELPQARSKS